MKQLKEKEYEEFQQYLYNKAHGYIWTTDTLELICGGNCKEPERGSESRCLRCLVGCVTSISPT